MNTENNTAENGGAEKPEKNCKTGFSNCTCCRNKQQSAAAVPASDQ
jgi:hypothetical protein